MLAVDASPDSLPVPEDGLLDFRQGLPAFDEIRPEVGQHGRRFVL